MTSLARLPDESKSGCDEQAVLTYRRPSFHTSTLLKLLIQLIPNPLATCILEGNFQIHPVSKHPPALCNLHQSCATVLLAGYCDDKQQRTRRVLTKIQTADQEAIISQLHYYQVLETSSGCLLVK